MLRNVCALLSLVVSLAAISTGCHFYVENDDDEIGDPPFEDDWQEGCDSDSDCPEGCFCEGGACVEFPRSECWDNGDCEEGFICDGSGADNSGFCIPGWDDPECWVDADCQDGEVCGQDLLECRPADSCGEHQSKESCEAETTLSCEVVNRGVGCTHPEGGDCEADPEPCTCEGFEFAGCIESATP